MEVIDREISSVKSANDIKSAYIHDGIAVGRILSALETERITETECEEWFDKLSAAIEEREVAELQKNIWIQRNGRSKKLNYIKVLELQLERLAKVSYQCENHDEAAAELSNLTQVMIEVARFLSQHD